MFNREAFLAALEEVQDRIKFVSNAANLGNMSPEEAGTKLRSLSIELGSVACMPFRGAASACPQCKSEDQSLVDKAPGVRRCGNCNHRYLGA